MKSYTYTAFDGHPDQGGRAIPPMTDRRFKARDVYTALSKAQLFTEEYVRASCDYVGEHRFYVQITSDGARLIGFLDIEKDSDGRQRSRWWTCGQFA